jgi:hypothetical protein
VGTFLFCNELWERIATKYDKQKYQQSLSWLRQNLFPSGIGPGASKRICEKAKTLVRLV